MIVLTELFSHYASDIAQSGVGWTSMVARFTFERPSLTRQCLHRCLGGSALPNCRVVSHTSAAPSNKVARRCSFRPPLSSPDRSNNVTLSANIPSNYHHNYVSSLRSLSSSTCQCLHTDLPTSICSFSWLQECTVEPQGTLSCHDQTSLEVT